MKVERICCIGAGYVGGPTMAVIASHCPHIRVDVVDINPDRISAWNSDKLPIFEPGLKEIVESVRGKNLFFSTDFDKYLAEADIIFISVNTPTKTYGVGSGKACDVSNLERCARKVADVCRTGHRILVEKSTVPVRASMTIDRILKSCSSPEAKFSILSNPEFLAEGTAVRDLQRPSRVLIGGRNDEAMKALGDVYGVWVPQERIFFTNTWSSELSKLVANALLAQRISSINTISALCEKTGADVDEVASACGMDHRIGKYFLHASVGFGGSCFQKDVLSLTYLCEVNGLDMAAKYWGSVVDINNWQRRRFARNIVETMFDTVSQKNIAVLGFAFKKDTGDVRETSAAAVCQLLLQDHACLSVYDPKVSQSNVFYAIQNECFVNSIDEDLAKQNISVVDSAYDAVTSAHAIVVLTEWDEFADLDFERVYNLMQKPAFVFDGRRILDHKKLKDIGFEVHVIGSSFI